MIIFDMGSTRGKDRYRRAAGVVAAVVCVTGGVWALVKLGTAELSTSEQVGVLGLLLGLVPIGAGAVRLLKPVGEVDVEGAAASLAGAVEASELAQRLQLLGGDDHPIDVGFSFRSAPSRVAEHAGAAGSLSEITDYYRQLRPRRLVITGAPGAGKTVLALELMLGLLEGRGPHDPVPVRLALASWDTTVTLEEWLTGELVDIYRLSRGTARALVEQRRVLPVLDGLDEMDAVGAPRGSSRAAAALAALNAYQAGRSKAPMVLTCRTAQYEALAGRARLLDSARVEVETVTPRQAHAFLATRVWDPQLWGPVLDTLDRDPNGAVAQTLSTPWVLTLAIIVYEADGDPAGLLDLAEPHDIRQYLLDRFVPAATDLHVRAGNTAYEPGDVERWLTVLADYLNDNARTGRTVGGQRLSAADLVLHRLWPITAGRVRTLDTVMCAATGLVLLVWLGAATFETTEIVAGTVLALLVGSWIVVASRITWPTPKGIDLRRLRTRAGRRATTVPLAVALSVALVCSLALALLAAYPADYPLPGYPLMDALANVLTVALPMGLIGGLAFGLRTNLETSAPRGAVDGPRDLVRADARAGLTVGLGAGLAAELAQLAQAGLTDGGLSLQNAFGGIDVLVVTLAFVCLAGLLIWAGAWRRYVATLLCTRGRLPWQLGRFLDWAYGAGLVRVSGTAYQFRHRELQDHLAGRVRTSRHAPAVT
ncbi:NACHT domain-containing protein [Kitasatospora sp. NBC_00374]|uniref:NACHT domain-containing protein n=1 Tax=Kitasatospora sp. NBC_00374 TaxID=2975964 RepID=UPI0030E2FC68